MDWIDVAAGCCERGNELADSLKCVELYAYTAVRNLEQISGYKRGTSRHLQYLFPAPPPTHTEFG